MNSLLTQGTHMQPQMEAPPHPMADNPLPIVDHNPFMVPPQILRDVRTLSSGIMIGVCLTNVVGFLVGICVGMAVQKINSR